ncbi:MAG: ABC transporter ATP-binding protein [Spirulina sp. SIO3F2]|nr:ABC transporter ATP-binding protein [Spirulina sp. SIO3F2]
MLLSALGELVNLGSILPFLHALSNAKQLMSKPSLQPVINFLNIQSPSQVVWYSTGLFVFAVLITNILRILTLYFQTHLSARIASDLGCLLYQRVIFQPYRFHLQSNSSDLINLALVDANALASGVVIPCLLLITNSLVVIGVVLGLLAISLRVTVITVLILGLTYVSIYRWRRSTLLKNSQLITQHNQRQIQVVQESLGGIREVIIGNTQNFFQASYETSNRATRKALASNITTSSTPRYGVEMLTMVLMGGLALSLGHNGDFSQAVPILGSLAIGANRLLPVLQQSFSALANIQSARSSLHRVLDGLSRSIDPLQAYPVSQPLPINQELRLEKVWFRYKADEDWILRDLDLSIQARTMVGFVGATGSGKSTTADLILGLLQPEKGKILLDSQPLEDERLRAWQLGIAHVPQHIFLADATITQNIAFGIPYDLIDHAQVRKAAKLAQIDNFVQDLTQGYDTMVGENGVRLSGGQRQRVGIARALYRGAAVIVFDEATSALDNQSEQEVMNAIESLSHNLTIILIAHRLSTVKKCDCIFEFQSGQITNQGSFKHLSSISPSFRANLSTQSITPSS